MEIKEVTRHVTRFGERQGTIARDFGLVDGKGRRLGAAAHKYTGARVHETRMLYARYALDELLPEGPLWGFTPQSQRNGEPFGAIQPSRWFYSEAERDAAIEAYFVRAEKTARKNAV